MKTFRKWIQDTSKSYQLQIEELGWIREFFPEIYDFSARIEINNKHYYGRGSNKDKNLAIEIAIGEAFERALSAAHFPNTNGLAVHSDYATAKINAQNELLERDLFLSHFHSNTPLIPVGEYLEVIPDTIRKQILKNGDKINLYKMKPTNVGSGYVCLIHNGSSWGGVIGMSFGDQSPEDLIEKATLESMRQYWHYYKNEELKSCLTEEEFKNLGRWTFVDHGHLSLNVDYFRKIIPIFSETPSTLSGSELMQYSPDEFRYTTFPMKSFFECPLVGVRCTSSLCQELNVGPSGKINHNGIKRFGGSIESRSNFLPHPIN